MKKQPFKKTAGFTMIELIVVLTIIAILAALTIPSFFGFLNDAGAKDCNARISDVKRRYQDQCIKMGVETPMGYQNFNLVENAVAGAGGVNTDGSQVDVKTGEDREGNEADRTSKIYAGICPKGGQYQIDIKTEGNGATAKAILAIACTHPGHSSAQINSAQVGLSVLKDILKRPNSQVQTFFSGGSASLFSGDTSQPAVMAEIEDVLKSIGLDPTTLGSWRIDKLPSGGSETGYNLYWSSQKLDGLANDAEVEVMKYNTDSGKFYKGKATVQVQGNVRILIIPANTNTWPEEKIAS